MVAGRDPTSFIVFYEIDSAIMRRFITNQQSEIVHSMFLKMSGLEKW